MKEPRSRTRKNSWKNGPNTSNNFLTAIPRNQTNPEETHNPFSTVNAERPCYCEIELAIDKLKRNKARGKDGFPAELLKHVGIMLVGQFTN